MNCERLDFVKNKLEGMMEPWKRYRVVQLDDDAPAGSVVVIWDKAEREFVRITSAGVEYLKVPNTRNRKTQEPLPFGDGP